MSAMDTRAEAETKLRIAYREWMPLCGPILGTAKQVREREVQERAARERLVQAAALLGYHLNRSWILSGEATYDPDDEPQVGDFGERYEVTFFDDELNARRAFGRTFVLDEARKWVDLLDSIGGAFPQLNDRTAGLPMDDRTRTALLGSIAKWEAIVAGTGIDQGSSNCPLCQLFNENENPDAKADCADCPVAQKVDKSFCAGTPYIEYDEATTEEATLEAARAELAFLRSLLPSA